MTNWCVRIVLALCVVAMAECVVVAGNSLTIVKPSGPVLSLCQLSGEMRNHIGRVVRVRLSILGFGGHARFFITAEGCQRNSITVLWAEFDRTTKTNLEQELVRAVDGNADRQHLGTTSILTVRVGKVRRGGTHKLLLSIMNIETYEGVTNSRRTSRWTGAAVACFASSLVRRRLREIAPPGQLKRWVSFLQMNGHLSSNQLWHQTTRVS
jgi:hypothetical protein